MYRYARNGALVGAVIVACDFAFPGWRGYYPNPWVGIFAARNIGYSFGVIFAAAMFGAIAAVFVNLCVRLIDGPETSVGE
jgi:hypothetical protein